VVGLLVGMIDTSMTARWDFPKVSVESVVDAACDGIADGAVDVLADDSARKIKSWLGLKGEELYAWMDEQLAGFTP
jgi:hypothetical protein